jgi:hypothetical protein
MSKFYAKKPIKEEVWVSQYPLWWSGKKWYDITLPRACKRKFDLRHGYTNVAHIPQSDLSSCLQHLKITMSKLGISGTVSCRFIVYRTHSGKRRRLGRGDIETTGLRQTPNNFKYRWIS